MTPLNTNGMVCAVEISILTCWNENCRHYLYHNVLLENFWFPQLTNSCLFGRCREPIELCLYICYIPNCCHSNMKTKGSV